MRTLLKGFTALLAFILLASCAQVAKGGGVTVDNGSEYIESLIEEQGRKTITLDLADEQQYEYVKNSYLEAGQTPENSPELFAALEAGREAALKDDGKVLSRFTTSDPFIFNQDFMVSNVFSAEGKFYTTLSSTVKQGTQVTYMRLRIKDDKGKVLTSGPGGWVMMQQNAGGKSVTLTAELPLPKPNGMSLVTIEGLEMISVNGIIEHHSTVIKALVGDEGLMEKMVIMEPRDVNGDGEVVVEIGREAIANTKIDYPYLDGYHNIIKIPLKGVLRVPYKITAAQLDKKNTYFKLSGPTVGGTTEMNYRNLAGQTLADALTFTKGPGNSTIIEWDISRLECWFDNNALYQALAKVNWYVSIAFKDAEIFPGWFEDISYCASNDFGSTNLQGTYPPHLIFAWSCIAEGSVIRMADGSFKRVETIELNEKVRANGIDLTVVDIFVGKESKPVFRIVDEDAHNLLVTETHPILTKNKGIVCAYSLEKGDIIVTEQGDRTIKYISKEMFDGKVYNLQLGTEEEISLMDSDANMFYANGILVGDVLMQMEYEAKAQEQ